MSATTVWLISASPSGAEHEEHDAVVIELGENRYLVRCAEHGVNIGIAKQ